ncbi:luc7-like protein 3 [Trifolium pratense]|uniref:luc7-like protein 3 n=1 Tax=Trifolium pratense TaxID=57577 RepID=UPI001E69324D|nr:luc7-like protein 3 [Trifolium pratense]
METHFRLDGGDWIEVSHRRRKEFQQGDRRKDSFEQSKRFQRKSFSATGYNSFHDRYSEFPRRDHDPLRTARFSHSCERNRYRRDSRMHHRRRSLSSQSNRDRYRTMDKLSRRRQYAMDRSQQEVDIVRQKGEHRHRSGTELERHGGRKKSFSRKCDVAKKEEEDAIRNSGKDNLRRRGFENLGTELKRY